jgi:hypothetical protein
MTTTLLRFASPTWASGILFLLVCSSGSVSVSGSHVYTDSFPTNDEYDIMVLDPHSRFGSPYGGFSRASSSRLASLPLKLPHVALEVDEYPQHYSHVRDSQGRLYACKVYHQDELHPESLLDSMFTTAVEVPPQDTAENKQLASVTEDADDASVATAETPESIADGQQEAVQDLQESIQGRGLKVKELSAKTVSTDHILQVVAEANKRLEKLNGMCAQKHEGWWSYEWCHHQAVNQFHIHMDPDATTMAGIHIQDVTKLGKFVERKVLLTEREDSKHKKPLSHKYAEGEPELARVMDTYSDGDICPETGLPRVTQVTLRCCSQRVMNKIGDSKYDT